MCYNINSDVDATHISACLAMDSMFYSLVGIPDSIHKQTGAPA